jgi:hypothetical protein
MRASFQNGTNGYYGTTDTSLYQSNPDVSYGTATSVSVDAEDYGYPNQGLIRFSNLFGPLPNQVSADANIISAKLVLAVHNDGSGFTVHNMLQDWNESDTWNSLTNGISADDVEASADAVAELGANNNSNNVLSGMLEVDVTESVLAWLSGEDNFGWALLPQPAGANGLDFYSSERIPISVRPMLYIDYEAVPGDANRDGVVDDKDASILASHWLQQSDATWAMGDFNGDDAVNDLDASILAANWGIGVSSSSSVPEPSCLQLLVIVVLATLCRRRD